jgi:hypothetical protein
VKLVAESDPDDAAPLEAADLAGDTAHLWLVTVPVEAAALAGVPAEMPDAGAVRSQYRIAEIPVEVWLVDGAIRRVRVAFHRDKAPYGGPDVTTTTYDWLPAGDTKAIEIPG